MFERVVCDKVLCVSVVCEDCVCVCIYVTKMCAKSCVCAEVVADGGSAQQINKNPTQ